MTDWLHFPEDVPNINQRVLIEDPYSKQEIEAVYVSNRYSYDRFRSPSFIFEGTGRFKPLRWKPSN